MLTVHIFFRNDNGLTLLIERHNINKKKEINYKNIGKQYLYFINE